MKMYDLDGFCIKQEEKINYIHKVNDEVIINEYINHELTFEQTILNDCKLLKNVILNLDKGLYIIYINLKEQLILTVFKDNKTQNSMILTKGLLEYNKIQIVSLNNMLNIFYIKKFNKRNVLCFRRLNNNLIMSTEITMDILEENLDVPYIVNIKDGILSIAYVKAAKLNYVGYRLFINAEDKWSEFIILDANSNEIEDINFIKDNNYIAYTYIFRESDNFNLVFGVGDSEIRKRTIDRRNKDIRFANIQISNNGKLNVITISENKIKIIKEDCFNSAELLLESNLKNIDKIEKCYFEFNNELLKNRIIIFKTKDGEIFTDEDFIQNKADKLIEQDKEDNSEENESLEKNNIIITEQELENEIKEKTIDIDKEYVNKLIVKIESYEEIINKFMDKFTEIEGDREKLLENIDLLNDKIKQKNIQINEIEIKLSESQDSIEEYKAKINDIEGLNKSLLQDHSDEIVNLKQIIKQKEDEIKTCNENVQDMKESKNKSEKIVKGNLIEISSLNERIEKYKNEIEAYISKITELNMQLNKNEEKINNLNKINKELSNSNNELSNSNNELSSINNEIKEKSNNEITNLKKLLNKIKIENMKYVNEIEELNLQLNELNDAFTVEKQEKLKYVNEIKILNIKIRELSRIRRNGFM
ncbi:hypothetical protein [Clostridium sp.]|uniref:hypothetical protein n=1 Tax=Clostridium sp. TaxID=1506 RepID=UPI0025C0E94B|nr:hypothetical protein [Clostridium sp.]